MIKFTKRLDDPNGIVSKLIFEDESAIAEAVAYRYADRGVVCFSVQSGCRIGCAFCGTGSRFIRDLWWSEMLIQIEECLRVIGPIGKVQIMAMSMGEPMDNWHEVRTAVNAVMDNYGCHSHVYISTVGLDEPYDLSDFLSLGREYEHFGLQFSLHHWDDSKRKRLLGNTNDLLSVKELSAYAEWWRVYTGKQVYFNYIVKSEQDICDIPYIADIVGRNHLTCSVLCSKKAEKSCDQKLIQDFADYASALGLDVSTFDPAGQDTIGGGCGQLLYVQERLKG